MPGSSPSVAGGRSRTPTIGSWLCGRRRARSTFCTCSSRCSSQTPGLVRRLSRFGHGLAARSGCLSPAPRAAMQWLRQGCRAERLVTQRSLPARRRWWHMSLHTNSVLRPTPSRPSARRPLQARLRTPDGSSAVGSANSSRMRSASSSWTTSGYATRSAGRSSTVDGDAIAVAPRSWSTLSLVRERSLDACPGSRHAFDPRPAGVPCGDEFRPAEPSHCHGTGAGDRIRRVLDDRGVNLMRVRDSKIVEALGYGKRP